MAIIRPDIFNVKMFHAVGNGSADDTVALQGALTQASVKNASVYFPEGTYKTDQLNVPTNTHIIMTPNTRISANLGYGSTDALLLINGESNVVIEGNGAVLSMEAGYTSGEDRHGIKIISSTRVKIEDLEIEECGGDGIHISGFGEDIEISNVRCLQNRRYGLHVAGGSNVNVTGSLFKEQAKGTSGAAVQRAGLAVMPASTANLSNISIRSCIAEANGGPGLLVDAVGLNDSSEIKLNVSDFQAVDSEDAGIVVMNYLVSNTKVGWVQFDRCRSVRSDKANFMIRDWSSDAATPVSLYSCFGEDPNQLDSADANYRCQIFIGREATDAARSDDIGAIRIHDFEGVDTRAVVLGPTDYITHRAIYIDDAKNSGATFKDITIDGLRHRWLGESGYNTVDRLIECNLSNDTFEPGCPQVQLLYTGDPNGNLSAGVGSVYRDSSLGAYVKEAGDGTSTGWVNNGSRPSGLGALGANPAIDWNLNRHQNGLLLEDAALIFGDPDVQGWLTFTFIQGPSGGYIVTWPTLDGPEPVVSTTPNSVTVVELYWDGTNYQS